MSVNDNDATLARQPVARVCELLDERGVEYEVDGNDRYPTVFWRVGDAEYTYVGDGRLSTLTVCDYATPEQAVEATLGRRDYTYEQWRAISDAVADAMEYAHDKAIEHPDKADPYWNLDEYVERVLMAAFGDEATLGPSDPREHGLIPHFWTGDETLHIDLGKLPERIDVTLPDPRGREVYSARVHRFEPERGECQLKRRSWDDGTCTWGCVCTACDAHLEHETGIGYNYCPICGAKVADA